MDADVIIVGAGRGRHEGTFLGGCLCTGATVGRALVGTL